MTTKQSKSTTKYEYEPSAVPARTKNVCELEKQQHEGWPLEESTCRGVEGLVTSHTQYIPLEGRLLFTSDNDDDA
jgi:Mg2+/Co2+ transporter CorB